MSLLRSADITGVQRVFIPGLWQEFFRGVGEARIYSE